MENTNFRYVIDYEIFKKIYAEIFQKNGLNDYVKDIYIDKFAALTQIMLETNAQMNITALTTLEKIIPLHYADCVAVAKYIPENSTVLDIGCGGGFPILPLSIVRLDLKITGLDSTDKKARYVAETAQRLNLSANTISARAEELSRMPQQRESYDVVISRAVARMNILSELALPFVRVGGRFLAMKGSAGIEEMQEAESGCKKLGGKAQEALYYPLHTTAETEDRTLLIIQKDTATPSNYPRSFGQIKKKPL